MTSTSADNARLEATAAETLWNQRASLEVTSSLRQTGQIQWEHRLVKAGPVQYEPVTFVSDDFGTANARLSTPSRTIELAAGKGEMADAWEAALAWRILRRLTGKTPEIPTQVVVPRPFDRRLLARLRWIVSPTLMLTRRNDVLVHQLVLTVAKLIDDDTRFDVSRDATTLSVPLAEDIDLRRQGKRRPLYRIVMDDEGGISVPRRLVPMLDAVLEIVTGDSAIAA